MRDEEEKEVHRGSERTGKFMKKEKVNFNWEDNCSNDEEEEE